MDWRAGSEGWILFPHKQYGWVLVKISNFDRDEILSIDCWTSDDKLARASRKVSATAMHCAMFGERALVEHLTKTMLYELEAA